MVTPDLEGTKLAEKEWTPEEQGPLTCRVCRTPQSDQASVFCESCGYRLPARRNLEAVLLPVDGEAPAKPGEEEMVKCRECGSRTPLAELCRICGVVLRVG